MRYSKALQTALIVFIAFGFISTGAAVSAGSNGGSPTGYTTSPGGIQGTINGVIDFVSGGFLAVTSTQESDRGTRNNEIVTGQEASVHLGGETCLQDNWELPGQSDQTFNDAYLYLHIFPSEYQYEQWQEDKGSVDNMESTILVPTEQGAQISVTEGECLDFTVNSHYFPEHLAFQGKNDYFVAADLLWENNDGTLVQLKESSRDTGTLTLVPPQSEDATETASGDISISPKFEDKQGEYPKVRPGEEITFEVTNKEGNWDSLNSIEWVLSEDKTSDRYLGATVTEKSGTDKWTYTFNQEGRYALQLDTVTAGGMKSWGTMSHFIVQGEEAEPPTVDISASKTTVDTGETVYLTADAEDEDGQILHYSWSNGEINTDNTEYTFNEAGDKTIAVTVEDTQGLKETDSIEINVEGDDIDPCERNPSTCEDQDTDNDGVDDSEDQCSNTPAGVQVDESGCEVKQEPNFAPQINNLQTPGSVKKGQSFEVSVTATDSNEDDELSYQWNNGNRGETTTYVFEETGLKTIEVTVTDGEKQAVDSSQVQVNPQDSDTDGVANPNDKCPQTPGQRENGCPFAPEPGTPEKPLQVSLDQRVSTVIESSSFLTFLSATSSPEQVPSNEPVEERLQITAPSYQPDNSYQDAEFSRAYANWAIIDDGNVTQSGDWTEVQPNGGTPAYNHEFEKKFETNGNKAFYVQMVSVSGTYNYENESWSNYDTQVLSQDRYVFEVEGAGSSEDDKKTTDPVPKPGEGVLDGSSSQLVIVGIVLLVVVIGGAIYNRRRQTG